MKSTGVVRKLDELGRIVLPKELRDNLGMAEREPLEIFVEEDKVILKKFKIDTCENCGCRIPEGSKYCNQCGKKVK